MYRKFMKLCLWNFGMGAVIFLPIMFGSGTLYNYFQFGGSSGENFWVSLLMSLGFLYIPFLLLISLGIILHSLSLLILPRRWSSTSCRFFTILLAFLFVGGIIVMPEWLSGEYPNRLTNAWYFGIVCGALGYGYFARYPEELRSGTEST